MNHEKSHTPLEGHHPEVASNGNAPLYEAAGNRFYINAGPIEIHVPPMAAFRRHQGIDTVLNVAPLDEPHTFKYEVHERDGSMSEMCGNGARAVAALLTDQGVIPSNEPVTLVTQNDHRVEVTPITREDGPHYQVDMGHVSNIEDDAPAFEQLVTAPEHLGYSAEHVHDQAARYMEDPLKLKELFPDESDLSNYDSYFLNRLQMIYGDETEFADFDRFCQSIQYRGLYQAGGEPHMLLELTDAELLQDLPEVKLNLFLKMNSFLVRSQKVGADDDVRALFPHSMNITFFRPQENASVDVYPAERGVHNGVKYDQTEACGTGSSCLGEYLMTKDPRYADVAEIEINTRNEHPLYIQRKDDHVYLIGTAQASEHTDHDEPYSFTTEAMLEKRRYFNPDGEEGMDKFFASFQDTPLNISYTLHRLMSSYIYSTANHPNFFPPDMYAALGLYRQAEMADALQKEVYLNSLDTAGVDIPSKKTYPIVSVVKGRKSPFEELVLTVANGEPNMKGVDAALAVTEKIFGDPMTSTRDNSAYKPGKELSAESTIIDNLKLSRFFTEEELAAIVEAYDEIKPRLPKAMRAADSDKLLAYIALHTSQGNEPWTDTQHARTDMVRQGILTSTIADGIADFQSGTDSSDSIEPTKRINALQGRIKNRMIERFLRTSCTSRQRELLMRSGILTQDGIRDTPLYSQDPQRKELVTAGYSEILDTLGPEFLDDYFSHMSTAAGGKGRKIAEVREYDGSFTTVSAQVGEDGLMFKGRKNDDSSVLRKKVYTALKDPTQLGAWYIDTDFLLAALGGMTQLGSERGGREEVFKFLKAHPALHDMQPKISELEHRSKGIICDTYDQHEYTSDIVTPAFPVATDMSSPQEYITLLMMMGGHMSRFQFQELLHDDHREPRVAALSFAQRAKLLTGQASEDPYIFASALEQFTVS